MKRQIVFLGVTLAMGTALAANRPMEGVYGDVPDARHAWAVHDRNRPNPVKIAAEPGLPPSDAIILFDGTEESFKRNWQHKKPDRKADWAVVDGAMQSVKGAGYIQTKAAFGDCQLHVEWASPSKVEGVGQGRGNSGVFLMGSYEIQVLDSYETDPSKSPNPNPNYADGQASAVYAENPPLVNASRAPGAWQTYDIVFHQPIWKDGQLVHPGSVTVFHNGVLTQDHWEMEGLTTHRSRRPLAPHATRLPLEFQDHGNPVRFRNVWIREIPSRYANTTHGGPAANEADVMALRRQTAARLYAKIDVSKMDAPTLEALLEVVAYAKEGVYKDEMIRHAQAYRDFVKGLDAAALKERKSEILGLRTATRALQKGGVLPANCTLAAVLEEVCAKMKWQ